MGHLPSFIYDLALIFGISSIIAIIFRFLKLPIVLGYLFAGVLVGPSVQIIPTVKDTLNVQFWAELGVIFLLFNIGLGFNLNKLISIGRRSFFAATFEVSVMFFIGFIVGRLFGWPQTDSVFLGAMLSISSTTIIFKSFEELKLTQKKFVNNVYGILIVEDLFAILFMVSLTTFAITKEFNGQEVVFSILKLVFFVVVWFLMGLFFLPYFFKLIRNKMNDELALIIAIALCFIMVVLADLVGFSSGLGAFVMGSVLSGIYESKVIKKLISPLKDVFLCIFFISIGMLFDLNVAIEFRYEILILLTVLIFGKIITNLIGSILTGLSIQNSIRVAFSLPQIGEFSFVIISIGAMHNAVGPKLYPIAIVVSSLSTFLTPFFISSADKFYAKIEDKIPYKLDNAIAKYQNSILRINNSLSLFKYVFKYYAVRILLNFLVYLALAIAFRKIILSKQDVIYHLFTGVPPFIIDGCLALLFMFISLPFLWGIIFGVSKQHLKFAQYQEFKNLGLIIKFVRILFAFIVVFICHFYIVESKNIFLNFALVLISMALMYFSRYLAFLYNFVEERFLIHLNEGPTETENLKILTPWDASIHHYEVMPDSELVLSDLKKNKIKENFGLLIVSVQRGDFYIKAPDKDFIILPYDVLSIVGTDLDFDKFTLNYLNKRKDFSQVAKIDDFDMYKYILRHDSQYISKTIRESRLRENIEGLVIAIERDGERILNPKSDFKLLENDLLWLVGDKNRISNLS